MAPSSTTRGSAEDEDAEFEMSESFFRLIGRGLGREVDPGAAVKSPTMLATEDMLERAKSVDGRSVKFEIFEGSVARIP